MLDYYESKPKKKKKSDKIKEESAGQVKAKPVRNFKIIDDDIDLNSLKNTDEADALADLLETEGPIIADVVVEKPKASKNTEQPNKWIKIDLAGDFKDEMEPPKEENESSHGLFRKRGEKLPKRSESKNDSDSDLDSIPRRRSDADSNRKPGLSYDDDGDISPVRKRPNREEEEFDEHRPRQRRITKAEEIKKIKQEEKMAKYKEWGSGLAQKREKEKKLQEDLHEVDKPLARYKDDKDLDRLLKEQEREEDPMLEYIRKSKSGGENGSKPAPKYRGPPAPPNRYNIMPGPRWDGVDRSNGFEKRYYESISARKARDEEAYKWSVEDM